MRKKVRILFLAIAIVFVLAACNVDKAATFTNAEDVLKQSIEAMDSLSSYSLLMENEQVLTMNEVEQMSMLMKIEADLTLDPLASHQRIILESDLDFLELMETELYLVDNRAVIYEPIAEEWVEIPIEFAADLQSLNDLQLQPDDQLEMLKQFVDDIVLTEQANEYVLTLSGSGTDFAEIVNMFGAVGSESMEEVLTIFNEFEINDIEYEIFIDKETFYQTKFFINMDIMMEMEGQSIHMLSSISASISGYDEIDRIELPEGM